MPPLHKQQELIRHLAQTEMPRIKDKQGHMLALPVKTWHSAALNLLLEKAIGFEGGVRELKNVIARAVYFAHFNGEAEITLDTIAKALAQTLPSRSAEVEVNKKRKSGIKDADAVALVVAKVKNKLIEMGVTEASIVTHDGHRVDYKKIGKVIAKRGNEFVQWCISNLEVNPNDAEGEATFLSAVNYRGKSKNPRNTIYQNWRQTKVVE